jgi:hypothetical protein
MLAFGVGPTQPFGDQPQSLELFQEFCVKEAFRFQVSVFGRSGIKLLSVYGRYFGPFAFVILSEARFSQRSYKHAYPNSKLMNFRLELQEPFHYFAENLFSALIPSASASD